MGYQFRDTYQKKAQKENYAARSAYKLMEIQKKFSIIRPGDHILDLGCAPGAWTQVAGKVVGEKGKIVGIDLVEVNIKVPNAEFYVGDIYEFDFKSIETKSFACVLSDMSPKLSGVKFTDEARSEELCRKALDLTAELLKPGGNFAVKTFMGNGQKAYFDDVRKRFRVTKMFRPDSTRKSSAEIYIVGLGRL